MDVNDLLEDIERLKRENRELRDQLQERSHKEKKWKPVRKPKNKWDDDDGG